MNTDNGNWVPEWFLGAPGVANGRGKVAILPAGPAGGGEVWRKGGRRRVGRRGGEGWNLADTEGRDARQSDPLLKVIPRQAPVLKGRVVCAATCLLKVSQV